MNLICATVNNVIIQFIVATLVDVRMNEPTAGDDNCVSSFRMTNHHGYSLLFLDQNRYIELFLD